MRLGFRWLAEGRSIDHTRSGHGLAISHQPSAISQRATTEAKLFTPTGWNITAQGRDAGAHPGSTGLAKTNPERVPHRAGSRTNECAACMRLKRQWRIADRVGCVLVGDFSEIAGSTFAALRCSRFGDRQGSPLPFVGFSEESHRTSDFGEIADNPDAHTCAVCASQTSVGWPPPAPSPHSLVLPEIRVACGERGQKTQCLLCLTHARVSVTSRNPLSECRFRIRSRIPVG